MRVKLSLALVALVLFVMLPSLAELYTEWLWFGEVGYQGVFLKSLTARGLVGIAAFLVAFAFLCSNLRLAVRRVRRPFVIFTGGGDLQPIILERHHLGFVALAIAALVSLFVAGVASSRWITVLQYLEATPFGNADVLFGRDAGFYIFTLPFLDLLRIGLQSIVMLALAGAAGAYIVAGEIALDQAGFRVASAARQHLLLLTAANIRPVCLGCVPRYAAPADDTGRNCARRLVCGRDGPSAGFPHHDGGFCPCGGGGALRRVCLECMARRGRSGRLRARLGWRGGRRRADAATGRDA